MTLVDQIEQFIPLLLSDAILGIVMYRVAKRLGKNRALWVFLSIVPGVQFIFFWIALWGSAIDNHDRIKEIERRLGGAVPNG